MFIISNLLYRKYADASSFYDYLCFSNNGLKFYPSPFQSLLILPFNLSLVHLRLLRIPTSLQSVPSKSIDVSSALSFSSSGNFRFSARSIRIISHRAVYIWVGRKCAGRLWKGSFSTFLEKLISKSLQHPLRFRLSQ